MREKLKKKHKCWLKDKIENQQTLTKESIIKMRNQKNKDWIEKKIYDKL